MKSNTSSFKDFLDLNSAFMVRVTPALKDNPSVDLSKWCKMYLDFCQNSASADQINKTPHNKTVPENKEYSTPKNIFNENTKVNVAHFTPDKSPKAQPDIQNPAKQSNNSSAPVIGSKRSADEDDNPNLKKKPEPFSGGFTPAKPFSTPAKPHFSTPAKQPQPTANKGFLEGSPFVKMDQQVQPPTKRDFTLVSPPATQVTAAPAEFTAFKPSFQFTPAKMDISKSASSTSPSVFTPSNSQPNSQPKIEDDEMQEVKAQPQKEQPQKSQFSFKPNVHAAAQPTQTSSPQQPPTKEPPKFTFGQPKTAAEPPKEPSAPKSIFGSATSTAPTFSFGATKKEPQSTTTSTAAASANQFSFKIPNKETQPPTSLKTTAFTFGQAQPQKTQPEQPKPSTSAQFGQQPQQKSFPTFGQTQPSPAFQFGQPFGQMKSDKQPDTPAPVQFGQPFKMQNENPKTKEFTFKAPIGISVFGQQQDKPTFGQRSTESKPKGTPTGQFSFGSANSTNGGSAPWQTKPLVANPQEVSIEEPTDNANEDAPPVVEEVINKGKGEEHDVELFSGNCIFYKNNATHGKGPIRIVKSPVDPLKTGPNDAFYTRMIYRPTNALTLILNSRIYKEMIISEQAVPNKADQKLLIFWGMDLDGKTRVNIKCRLSIEDANKFVKVFKSEIERIKSK